MIATIIVDDEEKSRSTLHHLLSRHCPNIEVCAMCDSVDSAIEAIAKYKPRLVFLDIEMPFNNGFVLLEKIKDPDFEVVFVTAYNHYALQAIKASAVDYLLKPVDVDDLKFAINKITGNRSTVIKTNPDFETLLSNLKIKSTHAKIAIPTFEGLQMINVSDIVKCTADESYTHITLTNNSKITVSRILKEYDEMLSDFNFFRVHNSCLVNLVHVIKYIKGDGGYVIMSDGSTVEVARRKKTELLNKLSMVQI